MGLWDRVQDQDIKTARGTRGGVYFKPGNYTAQIVRCKEIETRGKDVAFIAEFEIVESDNPECPVGYRPSFYVADDPEYPTMALGNIMDFLRAGLASLATAQGDPIDPEDVQVDKEIAESSTGEENLLAGAFVRVYAYNKPTRKGNDYTRFEWSVPKNVALLAAAQ